MVYWKWLQWLFPPRPPVPAPAPAPPPTDFRAHLLQLHNAFRARHGKPVLVYHALLEHSAQWFANDLWSHPDIITSHTPHIGSDGSDLSERINDAGYSWSAIAENIAEGASVEQVEEMWENHPPHAANILGPYEHIGIGRSSNMWVVDFGSSR